MCSTLRYDWLSWFLLSLLFLLSSSQDIRNLASLDVPRDSARFFARWRCSEVSNKNCRNFWSFIQASKDENFLNSPSITFEQRRLFLVFTHLERNERKMLAFVYITSHNGPKKQRTYFDVTSKYAPQFLHTCEMVCWCTWQNHTQMNILSVLLIFGSLKYFDIYFILCTSKSWVSHLSR